MTKWNFWQSVTFLSFCQIFFNLQALLFTSRYPWPGNDVLSFMNNPLPKLTWEKNYVMAPLISVNLLAQEITEISDKNYTSLFYFYFWVKFIDWPRKLMIKKDIYSNWIDRKKYFFLNEI